MKLDIEYLKQLMEAFEKVEDISITVFRLQEEGFNLEDKKLPFHLDLMNDKNFLSAKTEKMNFVGYQRSSNGDIRWGSVQLRLTAQGHEFLAELKEPEVWEKIKTQFKDSGFSAIKIAAKELATAYIKKKVQDIVGK
jgi:hypothetical protein